MSIISEWQAIKYGFDFTYIIDLLMGVLPSLLCICLHELSHGYVAWRLGDDTAKNSGRLSLNPFKHLDPMGLLMMLVFHVGWAKPVPVDMRKFKNPKRGMALTAVAGPLSNILISIVFLFLYGLVYLPLYNSAAGGYVLRLLQLTASISIGLAVFNCLPVPPLDGSKVLFSLMSDESYRKLMRYERYGALLIMLLVFTGALGRPLNMLIGFVFEKMFVFAQFGFRLSASII